MLFFLNGYHGNNKNISCISDVWDYSLIKLDVLIINSSTDENIQDWLLMNCAFIIYEVTQFIVLQFLPNF